MSPKRQRLAFVLLSVVCVSAAVLLVMQGLRNKVVYFYAPSELGNIQLTPHQSIRIGGLVEHDSVKKDENNIVTFSVTDGGASVEVIYQGLLPNLFREGQGVVAEGILSADGHFQAKTILAKHDENYMPPEVADALKKSGKWQGGMPPSEIKK